MGMCQICLGQFARLLLCCIHSRCLADDSTSSVLSTQEAAPGSVLDAHRFMHHSAVMHSMVHRRDFCMLSLKDPMSAGYCSQQNYFWVPLRSAVCIKQEISLYSALRAYIGLLFLF